MRKVNANRLPELTWSSPKGAFAGSGIQVSEGLGRKPESTDLRERHPFDVEILRVAPGKRPYPYHSHSAQWEFYHVISGTGSVRHAEGETPVGPGDAFIFEPGQPHQLINDGTETLVVYVVADNPIGESTYHHDTGTASLLAPERKVVQTRVVDYFEGEE
jgi:mannose-6-phosphate isomerase-like protein (cupin superfamily)